jgi:hypothetical protein
VFSECSHVGGVRVRIMEQVEDSALVVGRNWHRRFALPA